MKVTVTLALVGFYIMSASSAVAATANFDFGATTPNGYTVPDTNNQASTLAFSVFSTAGGTTLNGLTVTATALNTSGGTDSVARNCRQYSGNGLGICTTAENTAGCGIPEHQIDNNGSYEFMLFQFSTAVDLSVDRTQELREQ